MGSDELTVNFNINAVDRRSGTQFIDENKETIVAMINLARNQRGQAGITR